MQNRRKNYRTHRSSLYEIFKVQRISLQDLPLTTFPLLALPQSFHYIARYINADRGNLWHPLFQQIQQHTAAWADIQHFFPNDMIQNYSFIICCIIHLT
ncbi:hypothetical protein D3C71_1966490 [compost metagenome]